MTRLLPALAGTAVGIGLSLAVCWYAPWLLP